MARTEYQIVGRYMDGKEVTGYHLQSIDTGKSNRFTKEQVYFLVGKGQISNCSGQIYQDKVLLRGVGISLEDLPIQREDGTLTRTDSIGKVRRGTSNEEAMTQFMLVKSITDGRNTIGYIVSNAGGATKNATRQQVFDLAKQGKIGNARYQESNGKPILRGVNINLNELPSVTAESLGINVPKAVNVPEVASAISETATSKTSSAVTLYKEIAAKTNNRLTDFGAQCRLTSVAKADTEVFGSGYMEITLEAVNSKAKINYSAVLPLDITHQGEFMCGSADGSSVYDVSGGEKHIVIKDSIPYITDTMSKAISQILSSKGVAPVAKVSNTVSKREEAIAKMVVRFREDCTTIFKTVNSSSTVGNKLSNDSFSGRDTDANEDDYNISCDRFNFSLKGKPGSIGGFIDLISVQDGTYLVQFIYSADTDGDFKTETFRANDIKAALKEGWAIAVKEFKAKRVI